VRSLESRLRPPFVARPARRDALALALLAALALALGPKAAGRGFGEAAGPLGPAVLDAFIAPMLSPLLLPALGLLLTLRQGAVDLSVWMAACLGGVLAAAGVQAGLPPALALPLAVLAGAALGAVNGALVARLRLPAPAVTLAVAVAALLLLHRAAAPGPLTVPDDAFAGWHLPQPVVVPDAEPAEAPTPHQPGAAGRTETAVRPLAHTRMLAVALAYGLTMLALVELQVFARHGRRASDRWKLFAALTASGALSAAGGAVWLLDYGAAPVLAWPVGDLRIPAAAVLAGALYFGGRGRALVAGLCLPPALLLADIWRMHVWDLPWQGYYLQLLLLGAFAGGAYWALSRAHVGRYVSRPLSVPAAACTAVGLVLFASAGYADRPVFRDTVHAAALALWAVGIALLVVSARLAGRARRRLT